VNDAPKGSGAVVGEHGAHLVLPGEVCGPCVDLCALAVVLGCVRGKGGGGYLLDAGKSAGKRVVVVVDGDDLEPAGEGEGEDGVGADVARAAGDQDSLLVLVVGNVSGNSRKFEGKKEEGVDRRTLSLVGLDGLETRRAGGWRALGVVVGVFGLEGRSWGARWFLSMLTPLVTRFWTVLEETEARVVVVEAGMIFRGIFSSETVGSGETAWAPPPLLAQSMSRSRLMAIWPMSIIYLYLSTAGELVSAAVSERASDEQRRATRPGSWKGRAFERSQAWSHSHSRRRSLKYDDNWRFHDFYDFSPLPRSPTPTPPASCHSQLATPATPATSHASTR
jgi:hypothetical protein